MAEHRLSLAVNGQENLLHQRLIPYRAGVGLENGRRPTAGSVAIVGLGYVGLPTAVAPHGAARRIIGIDSNEQRLRDILAQDADLGGPDQERLAAALTDSSLELTADPAAVKVADAVIICVPTPVDSQQTPGNPDHVQRETPRVIGGATSACTSRAAELVGRLTDAVYLVSSTDAAEATKLYENIFRAVSLALANEFADACSALSLDPIEVTLAASTKPYGFLGTFPGPGVGGHCIPCDPHYLLWQLNAADHSAPLIEQAMKSIALRPERVIQRAAEVLAADGRQLAGARVIVLGASYKPGVRDLRESPALAIMAGLLRAGASVGYYDPLLPVIELPGGQVLASEAAPDGADWDLAVAHTLHPRTDYSWAHSCPRVLDGTYQFFGAAHRAVV